MAQKTPADKLAASINKILADYRDGVIQDVNTLAKKFAQKGAASLRSASSSAAGGTGKYAKGWTSRTDAGRLSVTATIYNKDAPGIPHLLENGHAKRNGGRTAPRTHIAPIDEQLVDEFVKAVKESI